MKNINFDIDAFRSKPLPMEKAIIDGWKDGLYPPRVSILCTTYNHKEYIEDTIRGFLIQKTDFPFEVIIHDDASNDGTTRIIQDYAKKYPNIIKLIIQTENQYSQGGRPTETCFLQSKGEYIAFCEGDDFWIDDKKLHIYINILDENEGISVIGSEGYINKIDKDKSYNRVVINKKRYDLPSYLKLKPFIMTCSIMIRRNVMDTFMESRSNYFAEDSMLKLFSLSFGDMYIVKEPMSVYNKGVKNSWSNRKISSELLIRETLDNIAILREVNKLNESKYSKEIFLRVNDMVFECEVRNKSLEGTIKLVSFLSLNVNKVSVTNYRFYAKSIFDSLNISRKDN